jgi:hypothetical protein
VAAAVSGPLIEQLCQAAVSSVRTPGGILFAAEIADEVTVVDVVEGPASIVQMEAWCDMRQPWEDWVNPPPPRPDVLHSIDFKLERVMDGLKEGISEVPLINERMSYPSEAIIDVGGLTDGRTDRPGLLIAFAMNPLVHFHWMAGTAGQVKVPSDESVQLIAATQNRGIEICGKLMTLESLYDRVAVGTRVVDVVPKRSWANKPILWSDEE